MKTIFKIKLLFLCLYLFPSLHAQISIGVIEAPANGALMQLKSIAGAAPGAKNADGGLLLSRVSLTDYMSLEPAVSNAVSDEEKKEHAGLVVYNLTENTHLAKGISVWNGTQWNCIANKEITASTGVNVKKFLYNSAEPDPDKTVLLHSIEINMKPRSGSTPPTPHYAVPQFRVADSYQPAAQTSRMYEYQLTQYWGETLGVSYDGYSNNRLKASFDNADYATYVKFDNRSTGESTGSMSPSERNEIWMYDETSNEIFHIQLFEMGEDTATAPKIYAILVEQF
jgi:hypothetical protein